MNSIIDSFLTWWLRSGRYVWSKLRRRLFESRYLRVALPAANSLEEIEACVGLVNWTVEGPLHLFDCISYPQTTWAKKKDDCDGFASLAAEMLQRWQPDCNPVLITAMVHPVQLSHTICAFATEQGALQFFDNKCLRKEGCQTYDDIVAKISTKAKRLICWDVRNPFTFEMIEFHRV